MGGSSHYNWVLDISDELGRRGHNVSFLASDTDTRFGKPYLNVKTVSTGPSVFIDYKNIATLLKQLTEEGTAKLMTFLLNTVFQNFEKDYEFLNKYFRDNNVDLVLCDHFAESCLEAATSLNIPYIVTSTFEMTKANTKKKKKDSRAPYINNDMVLISDFTTEHQTFYERFMDRMVRPYVNLYQLWPTLKDINDRKKAVGIPAKIQDPSERWKDSLKLINSLFGFSAPRPLGPLVEFVGPILSQHYTPLSEELERYLDGHKNIAYIAFGQHAAPTEEHIQLILSSLLESIEHNTLDGFIWSTVHAAGLFPDSITTSSNTTYNIQDLFDGKNSDIQFPKWAPQAAILLHPSTNLFISHGGLGSWYESMYAGTRMIMFPFFGDQPANSLMIERHGLGAILKADSTTEQAVELIERVMADKDGEIMSNVNRMQALVQIRSKHSVLRGADIVEEVAYTHKDGKLLYRQSADKRMSYIKAHNLDLYGALVLLIAFGLSVIYFISKKLLVLISFLNQSPSTQKLKKL
ncbi:uncharacterized protein BX663DRAFT_437558 [Cokeromyces recurvatus]|uniref:uncharacterized protein n=1 Tax=Cokeromyces recurvatus TaxID=90255 RepID=UPI00221EC298|nr:uncharacterized protein BX663DRAFT_437558 [Cokeromyces recurvatus]KAI7901476.1 hypothetical protein BX663DRAFT_437558 [Cokeromyces recurvatus]